MTSARRMHHSYDDYLGVLATSELKFEFYEGEIFAMPGGTPEHGLLQGALLGLLAKGLPASCRVITSDIKVQVLETGLSTFPDGGIVCGKLERAPNDANAITNPVLLFEVSSPSTEDYDRGEKLRNYKLIDSLKELWIVSHKLPRITVSRRTPSGWEETEYRKNEVVVSDAGPEVDVNELYRALEGI